MKSPVVEIFCVCREISGDAGGLNILGTFYKLEVPQFPAVVAKIMVVSRLRFDVAQEGTHRFEVSCSDLDGKTLGPPAQEMVDVIAHPGDVHAWVMPSFSLTNFRFPGKGDVQLKLSIDGKHLASSWLYVTGV